MEWPAELGTVRPRPRLFISLDDLWLEIRISNEAQQGGDADASASTTFDCFVSRAADDLLVEDMMLDARRRTEWLLVVEQALQKLLDGGTQNGTD